jgi:hypothetical protein
LAADHHQAVQTAEVGDGVDLESPSSRGADLSASRLNVPELLPSMYAGMQYI